MMGYVLWGNTLCLKQVYQMLHNSRGHNRLNNLLGGCALEETKITQGREYIAGELFPC